MEVPCWLDNCSLKVCADRLLAAGGNSARPIACSRHRRGQGGAGQRPPGNFPNFDEQSVANGRNPAQSSICRSPTDLAPEQPEKFKIRATKVMQTLKMTDRQRLTRGAVPPPPRSLRP